MTKSVDLCKSVIIHKDIIEKVRKKAADMDEMNLLSDLFKVLGDATRVRILNSLFISEMCVCDLSSFLDMSQSAISHQLRVLKYSRLVKSRREGKVVYYSLDDIHIKDIFKSGFEHIKER
jgi:ArsR family transcriptional regulator, lead/cadmium/zinc/bismuth-responsive transcriptional repressor